MPRKNTMRDNVTAVRCQLPQFSDLSRESIELALLYYESNVDETVNAFNRNGAIEALGGWIQMTNGRGNTSSKRPNNKPRNKDNTSLQIPPSNGILRPSQRVSNIFQTFAEGSIPTVISNGSTTTTTCSPSSLSDNNLQSNSYPDHDLVTNNSTIINDVIIDQPTEPTKSQRRKSIKSRHGSATKNHEPSSPTNNQQTKSSFTNNKKLLTKSVKDLQRQTSTLTNVEILFNNEIKSSIKRIDDIFKQIREIIKEREVELYLQMDKVKEQGLNVIHRRQQRAVDLRQRIDRCDRFEPFEIDNLRTDIKQFVTDRRYELGEELTSLHRFEYDQTLIESLKHFGHVLTVDRRCSSSALIETNASTEQSVSNVTPEKIDISITNDQTPSISNEVDVTNSKQSNDEVFYTPTNGNITGDSPQNFYSLSHTNGYLQYYDDTNNYQNVNRRRPQQYSQGYFQRPRPLLNYHNDNNRRNTPKQINGRVNISNNSETTNTYRRPRPPPHPSQPIIPV